MKRVLTALMACALAAPAGAQQDGAGLDDQATVVRELVVRAFGGPPWWRVSDGDTTVFIMASPGPLPNGFELDTSTLERRIAGANEVILPSTARVGPLVLLAVPGAIGLSRDFNREGVGLEASLPAATRERFVAARTAIGKPENRYGALPAGMAGLKLAADISEARSPGQQSARQPERPEARTVGTIAEQIAKSRRVKAEPAMVLGGNFFAQIVGDIRKPGAACLSSILDVIDRDLPEGRLLINPRPAIDAWADGDPGPILDYVLAHPDGIAIGDMRVGGTETSILTPRCQREMPTFTATSERSIRDQSAAITRALRRPGQAVAIINVAELLRRDGVLDRLQRQGFTITTPDQN